MKIHLLSGFLGSGKTTAIQHACIALLKQQISVGVITNDQGIKLVDGNFFKSLDIPNRQVVNGCFCCNYNDLDSTIQSLIESNSAEVIFAESVGSCTDIVATVMKPLQQFRSNIQVTVSTFADVRLLRMMLAGNSPLFDETVNYIYNKQLEEAGIIVVNKTDLVTADELAETKLWMKDKYPAKKLLYINAMDNESLQQWLDILADEEAGINLPSLNIDYDVYGAGEAMLAWLDEELELFSSNHNAARDAIDLMQLIHKKIQANNYATGHLKFLLNGSEKISFTATEQSTQAIAFDCSTTATLLINARVQTAPDVLQQLVNEAIHEVESTNHCKIIVSSVSAFQPGYPRPTHRMAD